MKKFLIVLLMVSLAASLAFSAGDPEGQIKTVVIGTTDKSHNLDPGEAYDFHTWELFYNVFQGLMGYTPGTTDLVPHLAESYTANTAGDVYTFKLKRGLKFSDGTPFKAQAVKWSIDRVMELQGDPSWLVTDFVESVDVIDDYTVRFNLNFPCGFFPSVVATVPYYPINPNIYPRDRHIWDPEELVGGELTGLGAYKMVSFKRDEEVIMDYNPNYWGPEPDVKRIVIRYFADATTMRLALEKGEVDLVYRTMNPSDIDDLQNVPGIQTYELDGAQIRYVCFETSESVFQDKRLRQAFAALINRQDIVDKVYLGQNAPLYSMVPMGMIYHTDDFKTELGDANVALANRLLSQAGYSASRPFEFDLWYTPSHYGDAEVNFAEVLKQNLEKSSAMKVNLKSAEWAAYKEKWGNKEMPAYLLGWYPDFIDPDNYTSAFAGSAGSAGMGIYFSDPEWDAMFRKEQSSPDPKVREQVFQEMQKMWTDEVPTAPVWQGKLFVFTKPYLKGVKIGPTLQFLYSEMKMELFK